MDKIFIVVLLVLSNIAISQEGYPKISFEIGYNTQHTKMEKMNKYFMDSLFKKHSGITSSFKYFHDYNLKLIVRPKPIMELGLLLGYQYYIKKGFPILKGLDENINPIFKEGYRELALKSFNIGIKNTWFINRFFIFQDSHRVLNKFDVGVDFLFAYSFSHVYNEVHNTLLDPISISRAEWGSNDLYGKLGLSIEYNLFSKSLFSSIGLKGGYQFHKTKTMKDRLGNEYVKLFSNTPINLDFSGFYFGVYLKIGK